jgi:hypothetical protein
VSCPKHIALALEDSEHKAALITAATCRLIIATCDDETRDRFDREWEYLFALLGKSLYAVEYGIHAFNLRMQSCRS